MSKLIELQPGQKFGNWTVLERGPNNSSGRARWLCECNCKNHTQKLVYSYQLLEGKSLSCGCRKKEISKKNVINMQGQTFNYLQVLERAGSNDSGQALWRCKCLLCGNETIASGTRLRRNLVKSCGCAQNKSIGELKIKAITKATINEIIPMIFSFLSLKSN